MAYLRFDPNAKQALILYMNTSGREAIHAELGDESVHVGDQSQQFRMAKNIVVKKWWQNNLDTTNVTFNTVKNYLDKVVSSIRLAHRVLAIPGDIYSWSTLGTSAQEKIKHPERLFISPKNAANKKAKQSLPHVQKKLGAYHYFIHIKCQEIDPDGKHRRLPNLAKQWTAFSTEERQKWVDKASDYERKMDPVKETKKCFTRIKKQLKSIVNTDPSASIVVTAMSDLFMMDPIKIGFNGTDRESVLAAYHIDSILGGSPSHGMYRHL
jgi:hypothetical protein